MIHMEDEATKLIAEWKSKGFNGIRFIECYMQPCVWEDWEGDGKTREEFEQFRANYASFVAQPDLYDDFRSSSPYREFVVDWHKCYSDMTTEILKRLGPGVRVNHRSSCNEFECTR